MVKVIRTVLFMVMLAIASPVVANNTVVPATNNPGVERAAYLEKRLEEIRDMDKSKLSRKEKKALRAEVKAIKKEAADISGGVYLSVGAIILIVLLIILLA